MSTFLYARQRRYYGMACTYVCLPVQIVGWSSPTVFYRLLSNLVCMIMIIWRCAHHIFKLKMQHDILQELLPFECQKEHNVGEKSNFHVILLKNFNFNKIQCLTCKTDVCVAFQCLEELELWFFASIFPSGILCIMFLWVKLIHSFILIYCLLAFLGYYAWNAIFNCIICIKLYSVQLNTVRLLM